MAFGEGLRIVRVADDGGNEFPAWSPEQMKGPVTPAQMCVSCTEMNRGRAPEADRLVVRDMHDSVYA